MLITQQPKLFIWSQSSNSAPLQHRARGQPTVNTTWKLPLLRGVLWWTLQHVINLVQVAWMLCSEASVSGEEWQRNQRIWLRRQQWSQGNSGKTSQENLRTKRKLKRLSHGQWNYILLFDSCCLQGNRTWCTSRWSNQRHSCSYYQFLLLSETAYKIV